MNLYDLFQQIPAFIEQVLQTYGSIAKNVDVGMIGNFYLGLQYDY